MKSMPSMGSLAGYSNRREKLRGLYARREGDEHSMLVDNTEILGHDSSLFPSVYHNIKPDKKRKSVQHLRNDLSAIDAKLQ